MSRWSSCVCTYKRHQRSLHPARVLPQPGPGGCLPAGVGGWGFQFHQMWGFAWSSSAMGVREVGVMLSSPPPTPQLLPFIVTLALTSPTPPPLLAFTPPFWLVWAGAGLSCAAPALLEMCEPSSNLLSHSFCVGSSPLHSQLSLQVCLTLKY